MSENPRIRYYFNLPVPLFIHRYRLFYIHRYHYLLTGTVSFYIYRYHYLFTGTIFYLFTGTIFYFYSPVPLFFIHRYRCDFYSPVPLTFINRYHFLFTGIFIFQLPVPLFLFIRIRFYLIYRTCFNYQFRIVYRSRLIHIRSHRFHRSHCILHHGSDSVSDYWSHLLIRTRC